MISVVSPLYNETANLEALATGLEEALTRIGEPWEVVLVDDGSTDDTRERALALHEREQRFKLLVLSRNFGHQAAYTAGLAHARGDLVVMLDGDLQDPPDLVPDLVRKLREDDLDVVYARRKGRREPLARRLLFGAFHFVFSRMAQAPQNVGNFCVLTRRAKDALLTLKEKNRYLPGLRSFVGFRQGAVEFDRPGRGRGQAKMGAGRLVKLALDAIFSFSDLPLKLCLLLGVVGIVLSLIGATVVLVKKVIGDAIIGWTSILLSIYFLGSVQLLFLGILGEYVFRIFVETQNRPLYLVREYWDDPRARESAPGTPARDIRS